jgi:hypothetical protein
MATRFSSSRRLQPTPPVCKAVPRPPLFDVPWPGDPIQAWVNLHLPTFNPPIYFNGTCTLNKNGPLTQWITSRVPAGAYTIQVRTGYGFDIGRWGAIVQAFEAGGPVASAQNLDFPIDPTRALYTYSIPLAVQVHPGTAVIRLMS